MPKTDARLLDAKIRPDTTPKRRVRNPPAVVYLPVAHVAKMLGVSRATVYELCNQRKLGHIRVGESIKITPAHVERFLKANTVNPDPPPAA